jgi:hypothetical protein
MRGCSVLRPNTSSATNRMLKNARTALELTHDQRLPSFPRKAARELHANLSPSLFELLFVEAVTIRDAVDLARFVVEATIGLVKFSVARPKTVGG